ncbi:MAG: DUF935 family protein [Candidatus Didemnitutus sp.]|nr:DUF935 family protein [Candidatus Didemnitutus sp.]
MSTKKTKPTPAQPAGGANLVQKVRALNRWRDTLNPLRGLTIQRAVALAESYFRGEMADLQWTYFYIEQTDADLLALLELRFSRLLEMPYNFKVAKDADEKLGEAQSAFLAEKFDAIDNLYEAIEHLGMAAFRGFSHCEKWVNADGDLYHLEIVDQWNCVRDGLTGPWKYNPEARSTSFAGLPGESIMEPERFLYREVRRPINRIALFKFIRASLAEKDWDAFVEIYGIPGGVLIGPPDLADDKKAEFESAAKDIAEGGSGYAPYGSDWKPNTAARGNQPFKERLDFLSEKLVLAGTAGKLTMLNGPTGLGGGQSKAHQEVFDTIAAAEARRVSEIINKQLVKEWLDAGFPGQKQVAYFELAANEEPDVSKTVQDIKTLSDAGYQVDPDEVSERTSYTVTLKASAPALPQPGMDPARIMNRATGVGRELLFKAAALKQTTDKQREQLAPVLDRLLAIYALTDPAQMKAGIEQFWADLPALQAQVLAKAPELAAVLADIIGTAAIDGFAEAAATRSAKGVQTPLKTPQQPSGAAPTP